MELQYRGASYNLQPSSTSTSQTTQCKYRGTTYTINPTQQSNASFKEKEQLYFLGRAYMTAPTQRTMSLAS